MTSTLTHNGCKPVHHAPLSERIRVWWSSLAHWKTGRAMRDLEKALKTDPGYAESWKANLAMAIYDESRTGSVTNQISHAQCNATADRIMRQFFNLK